MTRHVRRVEPMRFGLSNSTARHARLNVPRRDEPSGIWVCVVISVIFLIHRHTERGKDPRTLTQNSNHLFCSHFITDSISDHWLSAPFSSSHLPVHFSTPTIRWRSLSLDSWHSLVTRPYQEPATKNAGYERIERQAMAVLLWSWEGWCTFVPGPQFHSQNVTESELCRLLQGTKPPTRGYWGRRRAPPDIF